MSRDDQAAFPAQQQEPPGLTAPMQPTPDHGEHSYRGTGRLAGRHALITGGDSGIGRAVAIAFAREGADVAICYLPEEEQDARETARWVEDAGRRAVLLPADLREEDQARGVVTRAFADLGGLDILVNNAGYQMARRQSIADVTTEDLDRVLRTNLHALFWVTQTALEHLGPGSVIEWNLDGATAVVRRAAGKSSEDLHRALFPTAPRPRTLAELKEGVRKHLQARHARR